eukprot:TRINITY_DN22964_c0_g1_i1.p1 TRINITY_DN22964_c0_g1~~TRINITY_DN22964_c0_g1_i1.p1  ORF type:complete len:294 (-),score=51.16 TRINITY_DN22964_c0_g1_i1:646-1527(-)
MALLTPLPSALKPCNWDIQDSIHRYSAPGVNRRTGRPRCEGLWGKLEQRKEEVEPEPVVPNQGSKKGWFYDNFVADRTMEAKVKRAREVSAATKGRVGTLFEDSFQYTAWIEVHRVLTERQLESITPTEALRRATTGFFPAVILDVREVGEYEFLHATGAFSAPLFRSIQGNDLKANLRRFGYALLTDFAGTERNPEFISLAKAAVKGNLGKTVLVMCGRGGTIDTIVERKGPKAKKFKDPERMFGLASQSLKACYELQEAGFTKVLHVKGGFNSWKFEKLPTEEREEEAVLA